MEPGRAEMELDLLSQLDRAPTEEIVEDVDLNLSLSLPHYSQIGRDMAMNWGSSFSPAAIGQIARDLDWGLSLSLGPTNQADPVPQPRVRCAECGVTVTPQWRRGPLGPQTLCNACGLRFSRRNQNRDRAN